MPLLQGTQRRGFFFCPSPDSTGLGGVCLPKSGAPWGPGLGLAQRIRTHPCRPCLCPLEGRTRPPCPSSEKQLQAGCRCGWKFVLSRPTFPLAAVEASLGPVAACGSGAAQDRGYFPMCWNPEGKQTQANVGCLQPEGPAMEEGGLWGSLIFPGSPAWSREVGPTPPRVHLPHPRPNPRETPPGAPAGPPLSRFLPSPTLTWHLREERRCSKTPPLLGTRLSFQSAATGPPGPQDAAGSIRRLYPAPRRLWGSRDGAAERTLARYLPAPTAFKYRFEYVS